jgi:hypothetical protein
MIPFLVADVAASFCKLAEKRMRAEKDAAACKEAGKALPEKVVRPGIMTCWRCSEVATHFMQDGESGIVFPYCERHAKEYEGFGMPIYPIASTVTAKKGAFRKFVKRRRRP